MAALLVRCSNLEARRNQVTHSAWLNADDQVDDKTTRLKITAKQSAGLRHQTEEVTAEVLNKVADEIAQAAKEVVPLLLDCLENRNPYDSA